MILGHVTWSSCVKQVNCDLGMLGAKCEVMRAFVLAGLPTTSTCVQWEWRAENRARVSLAMRTLGTLRKSAGGM